jgi:DNA-binding Lrp family transcriptional regulator
LECYITNETFAKWYGTSESTIKRRIDNLVSKKIIKRETKNVQKGKERHLSVLIDELESTKVNLNLPQSSNCSLRKDQNEPIKDKDEKINKKDKELVESQARSKEEAIRDVMSNSTNSEGKFNF